MDDSKSKCLCVGYIQQTAAAAGGGDIVVTMRSRATARSRPSSVSPPLPIIDSSDIDSDIASCIDPESIELIVTETDSNGFWRLDDYHAPARPTDLPIAAAAQSDGTNFLRHIEVSTTFYLPHRQLTLCF